MALKDEIKRRRRELKLSQRDLVRLAELPRSTFQRWENGKNPLSIEGLIKLAKVFGITETELLHPQRETKENEDSK